MICGNCYNLLPKLTNKSTVRKVKPLIFSCRVWNTMSDMIDSKLDLAGSISELESLGLETQNLNELNDSYEVENLLENLKQMLIQDYKSMPVFTD